MIALYLHTSCRWKQNLGICYFFILWRYRDLVFPILAKIKIFVYLSFKDLKIKIFTYLSFKDNLLLCLYGLLKQDAISLYSLDLTSLPMVLSWICHLLTLHNHIKSLALSLPDSIREDIKWLPDWLDELLVGVMKMLVLCFWLFFWLSTVK